MKFWKIALKNEPSNYYIERPKNVGAALEDMPDVGDGYILTVVEMTETEYAALPEFMGF